MPWQYIFHNFCKLFFKLYEFYSKSKLLVLCFVNFVISFLLTYNCYFKEKSIKLNSIFYVGQNIL